MSDSINNIVIERKPLMQGEVPYSLRFADPYDLKQPGVQKFFRPEVIPPEKTSELDKHTGAELTWVVPDTPQNRRIAKALERGGKAFGYKFHIEGEEFVTKAPVEPSTKPPVAKKKPDPKIKAALIKQVKEG